MLNLSNSEILQKALEGGIIDFTTIASMVEDMEKNKYLSMHSQKVWQGKDGGWYTYLPDAFAKGKRRLIRKSKKKDLTEAIINFYQTDTENPTFDTVFNGWIDAKLEYGEIMKQTYDRYKTDYERLIGGTVLQKTRFADIEEEMMEKYIKSTIHDKELSAKAWGNLRTIINGTFRYAKRHKYTDISINNLIDDIDISPKAFSRKIVLDETQVFRKSETELIEEFVEERKTVIGLGVLLAFYTGLRCGELAALQWSDVRGDILYVTKTEQRYKDKDGHYIWEIRDFTKGKDGGRKVILTSRAQEILKQLKMLNPFGEYIFMKDGVRVKGQAFSRRLKTICRNCDISERSIHKARKTYATNLLNAGIDEKLVQKQLGHTTIQTTKTYYYFDNHDVESAKEMLQTVEI